MPSRRQWTSTNIYPAIIVEEKLNAYNLLLVIVGDVGVAHQATLCLRTGSQPGLQYVVWYFSTDNTFMRAACEYRCVRFERQTVPVYVLILVCQYVISSTEPRAQAVSTAAAVRTSEIFGVLAVFEVLHSLILHDESSFCNTGTRVPLSVWPWNAAGITRYEDP